MIFAGVYTALITPFKRNKKIDFNALGKIIEEQSKNGINGIVPCATTGESSTLSYDERKEILKFCVKNANGKIKVLAGTGSNSTDVAINLTKFAKEVGCDGALIVSPYYNKPTQYGLYLHFKSIADKVDIPIVLYNVLNRTSINIEPKTIMKLFNDCNNIIAIKEASGSLSQISTIKYLVPNIELISGDDMLTLPLLSIGGTGVISVLSNIIPVKIISLLKEFKKRNIIEAIKIHYELLPLIKAIFMETNPIPIKTAAFLLGMCRHDLRLPMSNMKRTNRVKLEMILRDFGLL
ncbi:MAG: 4-hydroxy-tetrahydrodipicolinate synthase [Endomicrobium sp.]|jgi:4-hydroxy-tetrahydrodipicolinate synthase|nr:4-hydroxy-tetrahydrodipicolinate synthase [Endomicrobium sp.]